MVKKFRKKKPFNILYSNPLDDTLVDRVLNHQVEYDDIVSELKRHNTVEKNLYIAFASAIYLPQNEFSEIQEVKDFGENYKTFDDIVSGKPVLFDDYNRLMDTLIQLRLKHASGPESSNLDYLLRKAEGTEDAEFWADKFPKYEDEILEKFRDTNTAIHDEHEPSVVIESNGLIMILTGGKDAVERSIKRAKRYMKKKSTEQVILVYDEKWHTEPDSYRILRITKDTDDGFTSDDLKLSREIEIDLSKLISENKPNEIQIQSNNYGRQKCQIIAKSKIPTTYFLDYAAGKIYGYRDGEQSAIEIAHRIIVTRRELMPYLLTEYSTFTSNKVIEGQGNTLNGK